MAHLWLTDASETWTILPLAHAAYVVDVHPPAPLASDPADPVFSASVAGRPRARAVLFHVASPGGHSWVLLAESPQDIRVNGLALLAGLKVLADRDEIHVAGQPAMFYSAELLAEATPFPGATQPLFCPRCKQRIDRGTVAVKCPHCDVWHHQSDELPCWTYTETCALCAHCTALDAGFTWTPEDR